MQPLKEKIVILFTPGPLGGAEKVVCGGFEALRELKLNIELWIIKESRAPEAFNQFVSLVEDRNLSYRSFNCQNIFDVKLLTNLKQALKETNPAIIHAHGFKASFYGFWAKNTNAKFILSHHGKTGHTLKVRLYEKIEEIIMRKSDVVISVSSVMKNDLKEKNIQSTLVENFLILNESLVQKASTEKINLLFAGRLSPEKGCSVFIKSLKEFPSNYFNVSIAGDGIERESLEKEASHLNIKFLGFQKDILSLLAQYDVLVIPSFKEGQPLILIEALSLGLPVVASRVGGMPELIKNEKTGFLFTPGDHKELAMILKKLESELPLLKDEARQMAPFFRERFSAENHALKIQQIYDNLLSQ